MKVVILAGGFGTRLSEETATRPKPMVEIGGRPIIWHIMRHFSHYGFNEFVVALGYKAEIIKQYFMQYSLLSSDLSVNLANGEVTPKTSPSEDWTVHLHDTGISSMTGGRIKRVSQLLEGERFFLTYGDGVANVDIAQLLEFHEAHGKQATVTAVRPPARFGGLTLAGDAVQSFEEKPQIGEGWVNGGFFVLEPSVIKLIENDDTVWESDPLEKLAKNNELQAYKHFDFWQCMDTQRDLRLLESLWASGKAPWKIW